MVTRRPSASGGPPPLNTSPKSPKNNQAPPYPTTPTTTALDRSKTIHSIESCYSPDLNNSPAFDLIDMNEARQRPRRDSDVSSHGTWADSDDEDAQRDTPDEADMPKPLQIRASQDLREQQQHQQQNRQAHEGQEDHRKDELPAILRPGPADGARPVSQEGQRYNGEASANPWTSSVEQHQNNGHTQQTYNPYRQPSAAVSALDQSQEHWSQQSQQHQPYVPPAPAQAPPAPPTELPTVRTPADEFSRLSFGDQRSQSEEKPFETAETLPVPQQGQSPLAPVAQEDHGNAHELPSNNPWRRPSDDQTQQQTNFAPPPGPPPKSLEQPAQPQQYAPPPGPPPKAEPSAPATSLLDNDEPMNGQRSAPEEQRVPPPISTAQPPASGSADAVPETPGTAARRQRSEHYAIKHINWYDQSSMRQSPILTQNANGPCPLLALVNALVLSTPRDMNTALIETLRTREQVSLGLLLDAVFDELISARRGETAHELPDVGELYAFLLALHTGMNVNPRFITPHTAPRGSLDLSPPDKAGLHPAERAQTKAGAFEETKEMRLYSTFNIPLIHGWTPPRDTPAYMAFERSAPSFEDAQNIQFVGLELEDKLRSEGLGPQEQQTLQDIQTIKGFLDSWPTQLTDHGLETISASLKPGQVAILFRNDHFSTLYKEPRYGALMTLVTDTGYSSHDEIVWESLVDVNGAASEHFSGDFRSVSHGAAPTNSLSISSGGGEEGWQTVQRGNRSSGGPTGNDAAPPPLPGSRPSSRQEPVPTPVNGDVPNGDGAPAQRTTSEQEDRDLALALQLQEEEEDRQRQDEQRRRREQELSERYISSEGDNSGRPPIPPRRSGNRASGAPTGRQPVSRRNDDGEDAPPPTYEQSSSDRPYRPAGATASGGLQQGNPLNAYDALRAQQSAYAQQSSQSVNSIPAGHNRRQSQGNRIRRRSSQLPGSSGVAGPSGVPPGAYAPPGGRPGQAAGVKDAEEKCVIM